MVEYLNFNINNIVNIKITKDLYTFNYHIIHTPDNNIMFESCLEDHGSCPYCILNIKRISRYVTTIFDLNDLNEDGLTKIKIYEFGESCRQSILGEIPYYQQNIYIGDFIIKKIRKGNMIDYKVNKGSFIPFTNVELERLKKFSEEVDIESLYKNKEYVLQIFRKNISSYIYLQQNENYKEYFNLYKIYSLFNKQGLALCLKNQKYIVNLPYNLFFTQAL